MIDDLIVVAPVTVNVPRLSRLSAPIPSPRFTVAAAMVRVLLLPVKPLLNDTVPAPVVVSVVPTPSVTAPV